VLPGKLSPSPQTPQINSIKLQITGKESVMVGGDWMEEKKSHLRVRRLVFLSSITLLGGGPEAAHLLVLVQFLPL
jgi:hypothetical protein